MSQKRFELDFQLTVKFAAAWFYFRSQCLAIVTLNSCASCVDLLYGVTAWGWVTPHRKTTTLNERKARAKDTTAHWGGKQNLFFFLLPCKYVMESESQEFIPSPNLQLSDQHQGMSLFGKLIASSWVLSQHPQVLLYSPAKAQTVLGKLLSWLSLLVYLLQHCLAAKFNIKA